MSSSRFFQGFVSSITSTAAISTTVGASSLLNYKVAKNTEEQFIKQHPGEEYTKIKCQRPRHGAIYSIDRAYRKAP